MADYNDGSRFGGDDISPYDDMSISFEQVQLANRPMLLSRNEIPRMPVAHNVQLDQVSQKSLTRRIEGFTATDPVGRFGWSAEDQQLLLIFLVVFVVVMQIKMMMQMDMQYNFRYHPHTIPYPLAPPQ